MGGLFQKKNKQQINNNPVPNDSICPFCKTILGKMKNLQEFRQHVEQCALRKDGEQQLKNLLKELREANDQINHIEHLENIQEDDQFEEIFTKQPRIIKQNHARRTFPDSNSANDGNIITFNNVQISSSNKNSSLWKHNPSVKSKLQKKEGRQKMRKGKANLFSAESLDFPNLSKLKNANLPFEEKVAQFKTELQKLKIDWRNGCCTLELNRELMLIQSMEQFEKINPYKELKINFLGEVSQDAGGLIREWFTIIFKELQSSKQCFFERADTDDISFKIHRKAQRTTECLDTFHFIGKIIAKALLENLTINACLNKLIYKLILAEAISLDDLVFIDKPLSHSLKELKKMTNVKDLGLYFSLEYEAGDGQIVSEELIPNGREIQVTCDNLEEYIEKRIEHLKKKDLIFINEIKAGLYSLIPENVVNIFNCDEFELILNGTPFIDVLDWKTKTIYKDYSETDQVIIHFWSILFELSQEELARFLQFCTGSTRVPIGGFGSLESNRGNISQFCITRTEWNSKSTNFIRAHTCFNRLDLPNFPNKNLLEDALSFILKNEIVGFGID